MGARCRAIIMPRANRFGDHGIPRPRVSRRRNRRDLSICMPSGTGHSSGSAEKLLVRWHFNMDHRAGGPGGDEVTTYRQQKLVRRRVRMWPLTDTALRCGNVRVRG
jgi:hypothetical protein